ncbi:hypothetical protein QFC24_006608 [Naganishia onofrii]|uniref:Uncharacterized protein n=1 Tax=Naganishia onofrii TaxID=1851511 RepID=A0ACC2WZ66_9TREE|nr:hypothetical protein QFC24_006608 [Naganishia onofrii]
MATNTTLFHKQDSHFPSLTASQLPIGGSTNIALEILNGTDETIDVQDFMGSPALGGGNGKSRSVRSRDSLSAREG